MKFRKQYKTKVEGKCFTYMRFSSSTVSPLAIKEFYQYITSIEQVFIKQR